MIIKLAREKTLSSEEKRMLLGTGLNAAGLSAMLHAVTHKNRLALLPIGTGASMAGIQLMYSGKKKKK